MHKPREYDAEACDLFLACIIKDTAWIPIFLDRVGEDDLPQSQGLVWKAIIQAYLDKAEPTVLSLSTNDIIQYTVDQPTNFRFPFPKEPSITLSGQ